jgi:hypothetical protein
MIPEEIEKNNKGMYSEDWLQSIPEELQNHQELSLYQRNYESNL